MRCVRLGGHGLREAAYGDHGDVVFLAECLRGVRDVEGGLVAEVMNALKAKEFAGLVAGFHHPVREQQHSVAGVQEEADFIVAHVGKEAQRKSARYRYLLAVQIRRKVTGIGEHYVSVWAEPSGLACGETLTAKKDTVQ